MTHQCGCQLDIPLAMQVQQLLFPKAPPVSEWCRMAVTNVMAESIGGDYYDFLTTRNGCQMICIGDVTGHGVHASLVMGLIYGFLHRSASGQCDPVSVFCELNDFLLSFARRSKKLDHFFSTTLFIGIIDPDTRHMEYLNAGHVAPMICRAGEIVNLQATSPPLGFFEQIPVSKRSFELQPGDRILLYTDGITEARNGDDDFFGLNRLANLLRTHEGDANDLLDTISSELDSFGAPSLPEDDCTAICIDLLTPTEGL